MAEQQRDQPTQNDGGGSNGIGGKVFGAVKGIFQKAIKSMKTFGILGTIFVGIIIGIVVILIVIGVIGFFLEMPSLMGDKLQELKDGFFNGISTWFGKDNTVYIKPEQELELAQYLENMGYPPYEFGFGKYEENEDAEEDEESFSIDSKYLNAYLLADYNTYQPYEATKANVSTFFHNAGSFFSKHLFGNETDKDSGTQELHFGMLNFDRDLYEGGNWDDFLDSIKVDMNNKTLTFQTLYWDGAIPKYGLYTYNMEGWSSRYGKPLVLSLTLHLATMAPDLAYRVLMDEGENTKINIGRNQYSVRIKFKYTLIENADTNFSDIPDDSLAYLDGKTEFTTEDFKNIKDFLKRHRQDDLIARLQKNEESLNIFLNSSYSDYSDEIYWNGTGANFLAMDLTNPDSAEGTGTNTASTNSIIYLGDTLDSAIVQVKSETDDEVTFNKENYRELMGIGPGVNSYQGELQAMSVGDSGFSVEYTEKILSVCEAHDIVSVEELSTNEEAKEELYNFAKEKLTEYYNDAKSDIDLVYQYTGDEDATAARDELAKLGLTEEAIDKALDYNDSLNSNEYGEEINKVEPYIESVTEHWYRNVYFTVDAAEEAGEGDYVAENYPDWNGAYESNDSRDPVEYDFEPAEGSTDDELAPNEHGKWIAIETLSGGNGGLTQVADAVRGEVNQHTKELFQGTADKPAKYFVYDGSTEAAEKIDELRKVYDEAYTAEWDISKDDDLATEAAEEAVENKEREEGTNYFKEIDVRANALSAFSILENDNSEDAEYILRDLKNLFVDLEYFTKEELRTKDTHIFQWPLSGYFNQYWPQKRFEKQQRDYGTIIRSKVSTDNIRNGNNADGSQRTDTQTQTSIYDPNLNPDATVTVADTSDQNQDEEEQNEITNPTDTIVDGFASGLNVLSPVTGEIIEEGSDYIKIKVLDNTAISEYEPFYNKYEDVCTGYIVYIKGFAKGEINSDSASEYKEVTHTDAYFTQYGYDKSEMDKWRDDEEKRVDAPPCVERDGKKYIKEGTVIGTTTNSDIVIYLINRENSIVEDVESYIRLQGSRRGDGTYFSLQHTLLSKDEFINAVISYATAHGADSVWKNRDALGQYYDLCMQYQINPEWTVATAVWESGLSSSNGNYWGYGTPNGASLGDFGGFIPTLEKMLKTLKEYQTEGTDYYNTIMQRYEERKECTDNGGIDPDGYGLPDSVQGVQSLYSNLGKHETGSSGSGGYYYMDPDVAGVTMIYETHAEFLSLCKNSGKAEHAYGTDVTIWENGQYTAYQVKQRIQTAKDIFGEEAGQAP